MYKAQGAEADPLKRLQDVYEMQDMVYEQMPYILLDYEDNRVAWSSKWTDFVESPRGELTFLSRQSLLGARRTG